MKAFLLCIALQTCFWWVEYPAERAKEHPVEEEDQAAQSADELDVDKTPKGNSPIDHTLQIPENIIEQEFKETGLRITNTTHQTRSDLQTMPGSGMHHFQVHLNNKVAILPLESPKQTRRVHHCQGPAGLQGKISIRKTLSALASPGIISRPTFKMLK
ncbi:hypothetical protein BDV24DRAFT_170585 [Aspergillus arachidicola]|uniref:Uncharacterized protein n=1 Tax=Aspergillus arachidicola TaxID=656916 RepID=A0A5N6XLE8_9EURO|nr:hypothetical protein BDV24DRAFT_170585 [Aspergillus arachidicola]